VVFWKRANHDPKEVIAARYPQITR
jgi:hypothetical protein